MCPSLQPSEVLSKGLWGDVLPSPPQPLYRVTQHNNVSFLLGNPLVALSLPLSVLEDDQNPPPRIFVPLVILVLSSDSIFRIS